MVKVKAVCPLFPSGMVTGLILNDGGVTVIAAHCCSLSTAAQAEPLKRLFEVNVDCDCPDVKALSVGDMSPLVALNVACGSGRVANPTGWLPPELCDISAVTSEVVAGVIEFGTALTPRTIHGLDTAPGPVIAPQPVLPGPALQPHQLFSRLAVLLFGLSIAVVPEMIRLKCAV